MDDDSADSKLSKLAEPDEPPSAHDEDVPDEWYQSGCGGGIPVIAWYFFAHNAAAPAASANGR